MDVLFRWLEDGDQNVYAYSLFRLQLNSPFVFFPILSALTDQRPEQTSTLDTQTRGVDRHHKTLGSSNQMSAEVSMFLPIRNEAEGADEGSGSLENGL